MTYYIRTQKDRTTLFDIEFNVEASDKRNSFGEWNLELHSCVYIKNLLKYVKENISDELFDQFAQDCDDIDELRGWLWETHTRDELYVQYSDLNRLKNGKIRKELEDILKDFCRKYNFVIVTD